MEDPEIDKKEQECAYQVGLMQYSLYSVTYALSNMFSPQTCNSLERILLSYNCLLKNLIFMCATNDVEKTKIVKKELEGCNDEINKFIIWVENGQFDKENDKSKH